MKNKLFILLALIAFCFIFLLLNNLFLITGRIMKLSDVTRNAEVVFNHRTSPNHVHIIISGNIVGEATLELYEKMTQKKSSTISGDFHIRWDSAWKKNETFILYIPQKVTSGHVKIKYLFDK